MLSDSWQKPIVICHNLESFFERCLVIGCCHSFCQIISQWLVDVEVLHTLLFPFFHATDTPIKISRETVVGVVGKGDLTVDVEGLMAHQHTLFEGTPREMLRRRKASIANELTLCINDVGVTIKDSDGGIIGHRHTIGN